jgi:hypothetical protein
MTDSAEKDAPTWRDYCKHYGPCIIHGHDRCYVPDDPAYVADMERRDQERRDRVIPPEEGDR